MKKRIIWLILSCLMALSLVVASCGPAVTEEEEITTEEEEVVTEEEEEVVTEEEYIAEGAEMVVNTAGKLVERPRYGGWYHISTTGDIYRWDDTITGYYASSCYALQLTCNELYGGDWSKGTQGTGQASFSIGNIWFPHLQTPELATGYEMPDDETIIYHIRQGVRWHNKPPVSGRELNAHDVAFSLWRAYGKSGAYLNMTYPRDWTNGPQAINALDDWTVEISNIPAGWQDAILASSTDFLYIVAPEMIEAAGGEVDEWEEICGTGPFMLTDYVPVSSLTFTRNPNYWSHNPLHPEDQLPYVDGVKWYIIPDVTTTQAAFRVGKIEARPGVVKDDWEALVITDPELLWAMWNPVGNSAIWMNMANPELPYDDIRVRKALYYGINHQEILDYYYEGHGRMICSPVGDIPEFMNMFTPLEEMPEAVQKLYGYYPEEAIELLTEAGYPDGFECTMLASAEGVLPVIKDMWEDIGVTMTIDIRQSQVVTSILQGPKICEDMYFGGIMGGAVTKWDQWRAGHQLNNGGFVDEHFEEVFAEIQANLLDWAKVEELVKPLGPYLLEQAYIINMPNDYVYFLWWPWLKGWRGETQIGYWNTYGQMEFLWIDKELRGEMVGFER